jgi:hypothetical protein
LKFGFLRDDFSSAIHLESSSSFFAVRLLPSCLSGLILQASSSDLGRDELAAQSVQVPLLQEVLFSRLPSLLSGRGLSSGQ